MTSTHGFGVSFVTTECQTFKYSMLKGKRKKKPLLIILNPLEKLFHLSS